MTDPVLQDLDGEAIPEPALSMTAETSAVMDPSDEDQPEVPAGGPPAEPARVPDEPVARPTAGPRAPRPTSGARRTAAAGRPVSGGPQGAALPGRPTSGAGVGSRPTSGAGAGARPGDDREAERGLRGLVGSGSSQVSVTAALRARDAARPTEQDLADAEERLVIVRRNWLPREELPHR